jgi:chorismate mutase
VNERKATAGQVAEVKRLRSEGWSIRAIAAEVFDDVRYRGRVERVLDSAHGSTRAGEAVVEPIEIEGLTDTQVLRLFANRIYEGWAKSGKEPRPRDLAVMLRIECGLASRESFERVRALTREPRGR